MRAYLCLHEWTAVQKKSGAHIAEEHKPHIQDMPKRVISMLQQLAGADLGLWD